MTSSQLLANYFYLPIGFNNITFYIYGAGGDGRQVGSATYSSAGAGAGAFTSAKIPYMNYNNSSMISIYYGISADAGGATYVQVSYTDGSYAIFTSNVGGSTSNNGSTTGALGGTSTTTYSNLNLTATVSNVNGTSGGNQGQSGTSNGYTVSGSGNSGNSSAPVAGSQKTYNFSVQIGDAGVTLIYPITSSGGGTRTPWNYTHPNSIYYGGGGAATPANYKSGGYSAGNIRYGSYGCILYTVS